MNKLIKTRDIELNMIDVDLDVLKYTVMFPYKDEIHNVVVSGDTVTFTISDTLDDSIIWQKYEEHQSLQGRYDELIPLIYKNRFKELSGWVEHRLSYVAQSHGYDDIKSCRSYTGFENPFRHECTILATWATEVWTSAFNMQDNIIKGIEPFPNNKEEVYDKIPPCPLGDGSHAET